MVRFTASLACLVLALSGTAIAAKQKAKKKGLGGVVTRTATSPTGTTTGQILTATATCPKGKKAFGGGFSALPANDSSLIFVDESRRSGPRSWLAAGTFFAISGGATPLSITASVHCRRLAKTPAETATPVPVLANTNNVPFTAIARCQGKKQRLISGGFDYSPPSNGNVNLALIYENQPAGRTWRASIQNSGAGVARTLTSYAYCAKGLAKAPKIVSGSNALTLPSALDPISASTAACPGKTRLSAGGFASPFPTNLPMTARPLYTENALGGSVWSARAISGFGGGPLTITTLGICT